jgi:hypothetical protein
MTGQNDSDGRRGRASLGERLSSVSGQIIYFGMELTWRLLGRATEARDAQISRIATRLYWQARGLERAGRLDDAFSVTQDAYAILKRADRNSTFTETVMLVGQLDRLGRAVGKSEVTRTALVEALQILRPVQADPERRSPELDKVIDWLQSRVEDRR